MPSFESSVEPRGTSLNGRYAGIAGMRVLAQANVVRQACQRQVLLMCCAARFREDDQDIGGHAACAPWQACRWWEAGGIMDIPQLGS